MSNLFLISYPFCQTFVMLLLSNNYLFIFIHAEVEGLVVTASCLPETLLPDAGTQIISSCDVDSITLLPPVAGGGTLSHVNCWSKAWKKNMDHSNIYCPNRVPFSRVVNHSLTLFILKVTLFGPMVLNFWPLEKYWLILIKFVDYCDLFTWLWCRLSGHWYITSMYEKQGTNRTFNVIEYTVLRLPRFIKLERSVSRALEKRIS